MNALEAIYSRKFNLPLVFSYELTDAISDGHRVQIKELIIESRSRYKAKARHHLPASPLQWDPKAAGDLR